MFPTLVFTSAAIPPKAPAVPFHRGEAVATSFLPLLSRAIRAAFKLAWVDGARRISLAMSATEILFGSAAQGCSSRPLKIRVMRRHA